MSGKILNYEAWEERTISEVKVQYYLRSRSEESPPLLAAVGNENSEGHMIYVVAEECLRAFGSNTTINAKTKWTKRRDVVKWLKSLMRKDDSPSTKLGAGSQIIVEGNKFPHAEVATASFKHLPLKYVVLALPAPQHAHLYEERKRTTWGQKKKYEKEKLTLEDPIKNFPKGLRSSLVPQKHDSCRFNATNLVLPEEAAPNEATALKTNTDLSSTEVQVLEQIPHQPASFQVGEKIEVLCQDSGMRGCWFTCTILKVSKNSFKVRHNDVDDAEASGKLEEWVPASRIADRDKLGLRHSGRLTVRPCPPKEPISHNIEVGTAVESWWNDGWWEGFISTCVTLSDNDRYTVFLPDERRSLPLHRKDLRVAKDWIDNAWVPVKPHSDILSDI